jgi:hypothetical protein
MRRQLAFIDEFGNSGLDFQKSGVSTHFVITAILLKNHNLDEVENALEGIRKKHFQTGEMKSSKVGKNDSRRIKILKDLIHVDFNIFTFVIDKRKLTSEGLTYKKSFYKFLNGLVYNRLYRSFPKLKISSDEIGSKKFMESFVEYVEARHKPDLFNYQEFGFVNSKSNIIVQLSDFITGTIAKAFDITVQSNNAKEFLKILKPKISEIYEWLKGDEKYIHDYSGESGYDQLIAQNSMNLAQHYINDNENDSDPIVQDRVNCMKFLLLHLRYIDHTGYIFTDELIQNLQEKKGTKMSEHYFRSQVIAKLRDQGVLIASSSKGLKLPTHMNDLYDFMNQASHIIRPLLSRIERCRNQLLLVSNNEIDILNLQEYRYLQTFFDQKLNPE